MSRITITQELAGKRLDVALTQATAQSRHQIQKAIHEQRVMLNGAGVSARQVTAVGEHYTLHALMTVATPTVPTLTVLYEDEDILAVDKPPDLVVHASETGRVQPTVAAFAAAYGVVDEDAVRPGIVHRLDKDTSGIMLIAKHPGAKAWLQQAFKQRQVQKTYTVLVRGHLREAEAVIKLPIGRSRQAPVKRTVAPGAREAVTTYHVIRPYAEASLLEVGLHTGRTHQIRVHFQHLGHPVAGDILYGEPKRPAGLKRQFLHASTLGITKPGGQHVAISSPLPPDLQSYLLMLEKQV